jgi:deoxyribodipyrimidine photo-lyase
MDVSRTRLVKEGPQGDGPVVYWMSRDQRARDNPALAFAQERAVELDRPVVVIFSLVPRFRGATIRQYGFMLRSLAQVVGDLEEANIGFHLLTGGISEIAPFLRSIDAAALVEDFDPLNTKQEWKEEVRSSVTCPIWETDAHNIVPCWLASKKQEYAARTFRPKIARALSQYMPHLPALIEQPRGWRGSSSQPDINDILRSMDADRSVTEVELAPGRSKAEEAARHFIRYRLEHYIEDRNDPSLNGQSGLSPYLHFGTISPHWLALEAQFSEAPEEAKEAFLEELIVRRELSDNFCYYQPRHDRYEALPDWSRATLEKHRKDVRDKIYSLDELEAGETYDDLWNASQRQMVRQGKMHGYLRMYWGKKVLEWSPSPQEAVDRLIYLNDRYELDGRDPNGYTGILWCFGLHDRPWPERKIFGTVRFMARSGMDRKFDVDSYIRRYGGL